MTSPTYREVHRILLSQVSIGCVNPDTSLVSHPASLNSALRTIDMASLIQAAHQKTADDEPPAVTGTIARCSCP